MNQRWQHAGKFPFKTRIGIHMGDAIVGNVGSSERLNYTALGDTINITSRLENINKMYHTHILVSETVYHVIKDKFALRFIDYAAMRGRKNAIRIYELLAYNPTELSFDLQQYQQQFEHAFALYTAEKWQEALAGFQRCLVIYPQDVIAPIFIERCEKNS
jgi:adenylate cyclase